MTLVLPDTPPNWEDRHDGPIDQNVKTARDAYETGFNAMPRWATLALDLRNRVVRRFGLKTEGADGLALMTSLPVIAETPALYRVGLVDKHLTFTLLTERTPSRVSVTTSIWFNHWSGRIYLAIVWIPHKLILRHIIRSLA